MIQPGMMFGGEGPIMQGTWYNPATGDAFTVRDSFFEDNQYIVTTTDGRYFRYDQLQNYIQSDMKLEDLKKLGTTPKNEVKEEVLPKEVSNLIDDSNDSLMLPEDIAMIQAKPIGNIYENNETSLKNSDISKFTTNFSDDEQLNITKSDAEQMIQEQAQEVMSKIESNMNSLIIDKALKNSSKPDFTIDINWNNYPEKEIEMLKDIMNIQPEDIVNWYLDNIQLKDFIIKFKEAIKNKILGKTEETKESSVIEETIENIALEVSEKKPKTTAKKSTSKKK